MKQAENGRPKNRQAEELANKPKTGREINQGQKDKQARPDRQTNPKQTDRQAGKSKPDRQMNKKHTGKKNPEKGVCRF
jgi:hypothetical protein